MFCRARFASSSGPSIRQRTWSSTLSSSLSSPSPSSSYSTSSLTSSAPKSNRLVFWLNGARQELDRVEPDSTFLIDYIRRSGLTGTKLACGEGGCGACTVTVTRWDEHEQRMKHSALNSCLVALAAVEGAHVTTVEAVGSERDGLHAVQKALLSCFGSQCGFCTPGFVMALYTQLLKNPFSSMATLEKCIDGNLCRCTGYRSIADALRQLAPAEASDAASTDENNGTRSVTAPTDSAAFAFVDKTTPLLPTDDMARAAAASSASLHLAGTRAQWFAPRTLAHLLQLKQQHPDARVVIGNTELGVDQRFKHARFTTLLSCQHIDSLSELRCSGNQLELGACTTLTDLWKWLDKLVRHFAEEPQLAHRVRCIEAITDQLYWFSGTSIRSGASLAGNIVTASPISDLNPVWLALDASFVLASAARGERLVAARDFFTGYRQVAMKSDEILLRVHVPLGTPSTFVSSYKQSQRREDDIAIVTCCLRFDLDKSMTKVERALLAFGGMAPTTVRALKTEASLVGKPLTADTIVQAQRMIASELKLPPNVPGGRPEYRLALCQSFLYKVYLETIAAARGIDALDERERLLVTEPLSHKNPSPRGVQTYGARASSDRPIGDNVENLSGARQTTGEAIYIDDIAPTPDELQASLVMSTHARARIVRIDYERARAMPGVRGIYDASHVPGTNVIGEIMKDEQIFATERVEFVGQAIAIVVADSEFEAAAAARAVVVEYEVDSANPPITTIEEAIAANSFFTKEIKVAQGDVDTALSKAEHVVEGQVRIGGQEHFYFEPQITIARPFDGEMHILASTQNLWKTQEGVSHALGIPMNKVSAQVRRIGGGFGGKETANIILSCMAAVAANASRQPVRLNLSRDVDMQYTGKRHPFVAKYRVGFDSNGVVSALDVSLFNNGGYSFDLSGPVLARAVLHSDNAYFIENVRVRGRVCKTNLPSNTAFRGFGGPQGMLVAEYWLEHVANTLNLRTEVVRERNLYRAPACNTTHYGQVVDSDLPALWRRCVEVSDFDRRVEQVEQFNRDNRWRKRGICLLPSKYGLAALQVALNQAHALVHIYTDGSVLVNHGGVEMGQGLHTKVLQVVAHTLGVPLANVHLQDTSTEKVANASPTAASLGSDLYCMAAKIACEKLNERLAVVKKSLPSDATFEQIAHTAWVQRVSLSAQGHYKVPVSGFDFEKKTGTPFSYFTSGAACSEVEIDTLTGDWRVLRTDIVMDLGKSLNPAIDIGQIEGAFIQGQGWLTTEDLVFGGSTHAWMNAPGRLFAPGPGSYKLPTMDDIPRVFNVHLMKDVPTTPAVHSSRGVGEPPLMLAGSVVFALREAIHAAREELGSNVVSRLASSSTSARRSPSSGISSRLRLPLMAADAPMTSERIRMACVDELVVASVAATQSLATKSTTAAAKSGDKASPAVETDEVVAAFAFRPKTSF